MSPCLTSAVSSPIAGRVIHQRADGDLYVAPVVGRWVVLSTLDGEVSRSDDDDTLRRAVCEALGETCEVKSRGIPWYVWPIGGLALAGGVVSAVFIANANRDYRFVACPAGMVCR